MYWDWAQTVYKTHTIEIISKQMAMVNVVLERYQIGVSDYM